MKKIIAVFIAFLTLVLGVQAQPRLIQHVAQPFIYGQNLVLSNNTTINFNSTNIYTVVPYGTFYTNQLSSVTNLFNTNLFNPSWNLTVNSFPNYSGDVSTNLNISIAIGSTNLVQNARQLVTTNLLANVIVPTALSTNNVTLTFDRTTDGAYYGTTAADQFVVVISANGVTARVVTTNLPASFLVGTRKIRLKSIVADSVSSSPGVVVNQVSLGGFPP